MTLRLNLNLERFGYAQFALVSGVLVLGLLSYLVMNLTGHTSAFGFLRLLDVGAEQSVPTYVSVLNLLLASILTFVIYAYEKSKQESGANYWLFLSALFLLLSIDESASIHENFANVYDFLVAKNVIAPSLSSHTWVPFGLFFVAATAAVLVPFLKKLPADTARCFLIAGGVFVTGALGIEYLGAVMLEHNIVESKKDMLYLLRRLFEEGFEMYGIAFFNWALYREILRRKVSLVVSGEATSQPLFGSVPHVAYKYTHPENNAVHGLGNGTWSRESKSASGDS